MTASFTRGALAGAATVGAISLALHFADGVVDAARRDACERSGGYYFPAQHDHGPVCYTSKGPSHYDR